jgi:hypothetical protein
MTLPVVPLAVAIADPVLPLKHRASTEIVVTTHCAETLIVKNKHVIYTKHNLLKFRAIILIRGKFIVAKINYDEYSIKGIHDLRQDTFF